MEQNTNSHRNSGSYSALNSFSSPLKSKNSLENIEELMKLCQSDTLNFDLLPSLNLSLLSSNSEPHLIEFLRKCFKRNFRFLTIGPLIVTLNRPESLSTEFKTNVFDSLNIYDNSFEKEQILSSISPNFAKLSLQIYSNLLKTTQALFFIGDSGGGKSRCLKEFTSHLILLSSIMRKDRKDRCFHSSNNLHFTSPSTLKNIDLELKIFEHANIILESFGHCQTNKNTHSSRYSKAINLSFNENHALENLNFRCFHFEFSRPTIQSEGESNFKIFYDIFDDIFFAEHALNKYAIDNLTSFRYTSQRPKNSYHSNKSSFKLLAAGFQNLCNLSKTLQNNYIYNILAAILHLGDIEIEVNTNNDNTIFFSSDEISTDHQCRVLKLLGLTLESLLGVVTKKTIKVAGSIIENKMDINEAKIIRDNFACHIYAGLFRWILSQVNLGLTSQLPIKMEIVDNDKTTPATTLPATTLPTSTLPTSTTTITEKSDTNTYSSQPLCHLYDLMGFEIIEHNQLDQLCINYSNERIVQHFHQIIFINEHKIYENDNINIPDITYPDNTQVVRTIDNRTNGLFLLSEEQLRLKGSTDQKLAQYFYAQNSSNKSFFAAKAEQKNSEFIIKHYLGNVKYEINGFLSRNRNEVSTEIITCLKSSSIQFIRDELVFHVEKATGSGNINGTSSSRLSISSIPETASTDATETASTSATSANNNTTNNNNDTTTTTTDTNTTPTTPTTATNRPSLVKSRSAAFIPDPEKNPGRGISRASSMASRNGSLKIQGKTLTQLTVTYVNDIITESSSNLGESHFCLCLKLNNIYDPTTFDPIVVANQIRPYNLLEIMSFYNQTYPHKIDIIRFINIFSSISLITIKDTQQIKEYLQNLINCRRHHLHQHQHQSKDSNEEIWKNLCHTFIKLIPELPEFDFECQIIIGKSNQSQENLLELVKNGIMIGNSSVYLTGLSYYYLCHALQLSIRLNGLKIWHFYQNKRFTDDQKIAGMKIGVLMKKFLVRREAKKKTARLATIAMTQLTLKRLREAKKNKIEAHETPSGVVENTENLITTTTSLPPPPPPPSNTLPSENLPEQSQHSTLIIPITNNTHTETTTTTTSDIIEEITPVVVATPQLQSQSQPQPPSVTIPSPPSVRISDHVEIIPANVGQTELSTESSTQILLQEQQALIRTLRDENVSLKRQLITLSSMLAEASRPTNQQSDKPKDSSIKSSVKFSTNLLPPSSSSVSSVSSSIGPPLPAPAPYTPARKVLKTQSSSLETFSLDSIYGGELSKDLEPSLVELKPEYEVFIERTLKSLKEDISYLLVPTPFYKFGRTGSCHQTFIQLTPNFQSLTWVPHNTLTKSRDDCVVHLRSVWRLVEGQSTLPFETYRGLTHGSMPAHRSFSIVYGFRSLDLCALDDEIYRKWFNGLRYILQLMNGEIQEAGFDRQYLKKKWNCVDKKNRGFLSRREVIQLIAGMDILFDRTSFTTAVIRSTIGHSLNNEITFSQFDSLVYQLRRRPDLEIIWNRILNGYDFSSTSYQPLQIDSEFDSGQLQEVISVSDVRAFWKISQGRDLSDTEAKALIAEGMGEMHQVDFPVLSYNGFINIMTHLKNDGYDPVLCTHHTRDMCYPLQHYFISCSDGVDMDIPKKEIKSNSLLEDSHRPNCYANAINNGCRALELRCYEAKVASNNRVDVFVGSRKVTTRITFKETMILIQRIAFLHTQFPLILMLEISCGIEQQKRMTTILQKVFGESLFTPLELKSKLLPSPSDLRGRVIIFLSHRKKDIDTAYTIYEETEEDLKLNEFTTPMKDMNNSSLSPSSSFNLKKSTSIEKNRNQSSGNNKSNFGDSNWFNDISYYSDLGSDGSDQEFSINKPLNTVRNNSPKVVTNNTANNTANNNNNNNNNSSFNINSNNRTSSQMKYHVVDPEISPIHGSQKNNEVGAIDSSLMRLCHYSKGHKLSTYNLRLFLDRIEGHEDAEASMIIDNMSKFSCVYMDSVTKSYGSYGGICTAWDCGVSMVSICREYPSLGTKIIHGKFRQNGGIGYILKPEKFRCQPTEPTSTATPAVTVTPPATKSLSTLAIHIISGQELPEVFVDPDSTKISKEKGYAVVIDLNGALSDREDIQAKTLYIRKHGRNPFWNELFTFGIQDQSRGQLTVRVFHNEECVCFSSVPLTCLRVGYRSMALYEENEDNNYQIEILPLSKLFIRIGLISNDNTSSSGGIGGGNGNAGSGGGGNSSSSPIKSDYYREFSPTSSPSPPLGRAQDNNSRMVGMDVSPGNKHWKRLKSRGSDVSATNEEEKIKDSPPPSSNSSPSKHRQSSRRSSSNGGGGGDNLQNESPTRSSSHRDRDRRRSSSSRHEGRSRREKAASRGQSMEG